MKNKSEFSKKLIQIQKELGIMHERSQLLIKMKNLLEENKIVKSYIATSNSLGDVKKEIKNKEEKAYWLKIESCNHIMLKTKIQIKNNDSCKENTFYCPKCGLTNIVGFLPDINNSYYDSRKMSIAYYGEFLICPKPLLDEIISIEHAQNLYLKAFEIVGNQDDVEAIREQMIILFAKEKEEDIKKYTKTK